MGKVQEQIIRDKRQEISNKKQRTRRVLSIFLVVGFLFLFASSVQAASLYFSPSSGSYTVGQTFLASVYVSSADQTMNAAFGVISFPRDKLEITSLSKSGSIFTLWVQEPSFSNSVGTINFEGIVLNPGFSGATGKILTANFRVRAAGVATLNFSSGSVLANDGKGTNILTSLGNAQFSLGGVAPTIPESTTPSTVFGAPSAAQISSPTHPDPNEWYNNSNPKFTWQVSDDVTAARLLYNKFSNSQPTVLYVSPIAEKELNNIKDGIYYFHIQLKNKNGWGGISHFRFQVDTQPPEPFVIEVDNGGDSTNPSPTLYFDTADFPSGVKYYEVKYSEAEPVFVTVAFLKENPYKIPPQLPGKHTIIVKAIDYADNLTISTTNITIEPIEAPLITDFPQTVRVGDILTVKGTSQYPGATVTVFVKKEGEEPIGKDVKTDSEGNWSFIFEKSLEKGTYQVWAQITDKRGAKSNPTEKITIATTSSAFLKFGKIAIDYLTTIITLVAFIILLILIGFYARYRVSRWRKEIQKETKEVNESVAKAFEILRDKIEKEVAKLDSKPGLSQKEKKIYDELKEALRESEKAIGREVKDVKKLTEE